MDAACPTFNQAHNAETQPLSCEQIRKTANLLDKVWLAYLISIIGLYIPIIDFNFCSIAGSCMLAFVLIKFTQDGGGKWKKAGVLNAVEIPILLLMSGVSSLAIIARPVALLNLPLAIGLIIVSIMSYWIIMDQIAESLADAGLGEEVEVIYAARLYFVISQVIVVVLAFVIGLVLGVVLALTKSEAGFWADALGLLVLPVNWIAGALFVLRPISQARRALRNAAMERA